MEINQQKEIIEIIGIYEEGQVLQYNKKYAMLIT